VEPVGVVGSLARDLVAGAPPRPGGAPVFAARALRALGRPGRIACRCAAHDREALLPGLLATGLPVACGDSAVTASFSFSYNGDDRVMAVEAVGDAWTPADADGWVAEALGAAEWVQVAPLVRSDFPAATLVRLARGRRLLLDGQGLVRVPALGPLRLDGAYDPAALRAATALKLSEEEARVLTGAGRELDPVALRSLGVAEVIVTRGSLGSLVVTAAGGAEHVAAVQVEGVADPTGAGDAFAVAYVAARADGAEPVEAARRAAAAVALVLGGTA
jgi:sugar/nucleoside kinase (ribokinase family)